MEFLVLGPLEVRRDRQTIELRGSKRRAVLALLVLHANEVVRSDLLIEEVWGDERPANTSAALQNHVSRLRKDLGADVLVTKPWGYVLRTDAEAIDLRRFERLVAEAKPLAAHERSAMLADALALWRGPPLADLAHQTALTVQIARLEELRLGALEQRIDADLELGRHQELVSELEGLVAEQPLRERLRGQLILALYRSGRQAEALETYRETRRVLVEELGIEPSAELRELERSILRQDPLLASAPRPPEKVNAPPAARWRWPRSPLALAAALLLLGGAVATAMIVTTKRGGESPVRRAAPGAEPTAVSPTSSANTHRTMTNPTARTRVKSAAPNRAPATKRRVSHPASAPQHFRETTRARRGPARPEPADIPKAVYVPQQKVYWLSDDFDEPGTNDGMWDVATNGPEAVNAIEHDGELELAVNPQAVAGDGGFDTHYGTQCRVRGDFDARVEFKLLTWPAGDGMTVTLGAYFGSWLPPLDWMWVARGGAGANGGLEVYATGVRSNNRVVQTVDTAGALRITRVNGVLSTYYRKLERLYSGDRQTWVKLASGIAPHPANLILSLSSASDQFGQKAAVAAFDNFQATADAVLCDGAPLPPLKPAP